MTSVKFSLIRSRVFLLLGVMLLSSTAVFSSAFYLDAMRKTKLGFDNDIRSSKVNVARILEDISLVNTYQTGFEQLMAAGFFDDESRLLWIEQLENTAIKLNLPNLHYKIGAQRVLGEGEFSVPSAFVLLETVLSFETSLLHEGDLVDLVSDLRNLDTGIFVLNSCQLNRGEGNGSTTLKLQFKGSCDILFYTLRENTMSQNMPGVNDV